MEPPRVPAGLPACLLCVYTAAGRNIGESGSGRAASGMDGHGRTDREEGA
jgi:hypothetical protein